MYYKKYDYLLKFERFINKCFNCYFEQFCEIWNNFSMSMTPIDKFWAKLLINKICI